MSGEHKHTDFDFQQVEQLIKEGKLDEAKRSLAFFKEKEDKSLSHRTKVTLLKGQINKAKGSLDQALVTFQKSLTMSEELGDKLQIAKSLDGIARVYSSRGIKDRALEYFEKSLNLFKEIGDAHDIAWSFWNIGSIYCKAGDLVKSSDYFELSKQFFEKIGDNKGNGQALYCLSAMAHDKGELDRALEYQNQSLIHYKKVGNTIKISKSFIKLGFIFISKGDLNQAQDYLQQSLEISEGIDAHHKAWALVGIGEIYRLKGELDRALKCLKQSLALREEFSQNQDIAECLYYIGKILLQQGELNQAWEYLEKSLGLLEEKNNFLFITGILLDLISLVIEQEEHEQSNKYLHRLKLINDQEKNMIINQRYRLARALILRDSPRIRDKALSQKIFQQITEEEIVDHRITVAAMYNLCESLLDELKAYGENSVMLEAKSLAKQITSLAQKQFSSLLAIDALILQAKLALVEGNLSDAEEFLEQAKFTAEERDLGKYIISKVYAEKRNLDDQYDEWENLIKSNASFKKRLEQAQLKDYLYEALKLARVGKDHKICE